MWRVLYTGVHFVRDLPIFYDAVRFRYSLNSPTASSSRLGLTLCKLVFGFIVCSRVIPYFWIPYHNTSSHYETWHTIDTLWVTPRYWFQSRWLHKTQGWPFCQRLMVRASLFLMGSMSLTWSRSSHCFDAIRRRHPVAWLALTVFGPSRLRESLPLAKDKGSK